MLPVMTAALLRGWALMGCAGRSERWRGGGMERAEGIIETLSRAVQTLL